MRLQRAEAHRKMTWANGLGSTDEVLAFPRSDGWTWRLSIADVTADGPFSLLPGVDRCLAVASGNGMTLHIGATAHVLARFDSVTFSGDCEAHAELVDGPVRDLNVMVRRGYGHGMPSLHVERFNEGAEFGFDGGVAIVVLDGSVTAHSLPGAPATRYDAFIADLARVDDNSPAFHALTGATVAFVRLLPSKDLP